MSCLYDKIVELTGSFKLMGMSTKVGRMKMELKLHSGRTELGGNGQSSSIALNLI